MNNDLASVAVDVLQYALLWLALYHLFQYLISPYLLGRFSTKYSQLTSSKQTYWNASLVSTSHAVLISAMALRAAYYGKFWDTWPILDMNQTTPLSHTTERVMNGYLFADALLALYHRNSPAWTKTFYTVMGHHIVVFGIGMCICVLDFGHVYSMIGMLLEMTTPFVNLRWILYTIQETKTTLYLINGLVLVLLWFLVRIVVAGPFAVYPLWVDKKERSLHVIITFVVTYTLIYPLQCFWFSKLLKGAYKALSTGREESEGKKDKVS